MGYAQLWCYMWRNSLGRFRPEIVCRFVRGFNYSMMSRFLVVLGSVIYDFASDVKHVMVIKLDLVRMLFSMRQVGVKIQFRVIGLLGTRFWSKRQKDKK